MKSQVHNPSRRIVFFGTILGGISSVIGSAIYAFVDFVDSIIPRGIQYAISTLDFRFTSFIFALMFSILPATIGGNILGHMLERDVTRGTFSKKSAFKKGIIMGCLFGIGLAGVAVLVSAGTRIPWDFVAIESIKGLALATLAGWWVASRLARKIEKQSKEF